MTDPGPPQTPSEHTQRGGSCFWGPKKCTKVAPKCDKTLFLPVFTLLAEHQEHKPIDNRSTHNSTYKEFDQNWMFLDCQPN